MGLLTLNGMITAQGSMTPQIGRWHSVYRKVEEMRRWSPYTFCFNNPLRFLDLDGMKPGDLFAGPDLAAIDFGICYNGASIKQDREYGTEIYVVLKDGKTQYTYAEPGYSGVGEGEAYIDQAPEGVKVVAYAHTHAAYKNNPNSDHFSISTKLYSFGQELSTPGDIDIADDLNILAYAAVPNGNLLKYNKKYKKSKEHSYGRSIIYQNLPSDPEDPSRKYKNDAKDLNNPAHEGNKENKYNTNSQPKKANDNMNWMQIISSWLDQNSNINITVR